MNMAWQGGPEAKTRRFRLALAIAIPIFLYTSTTTIAAIHDVGISRNGFSVGTDGTLLNVVDECWRNDPLWRHRRQRLARCSVGFAGKMTNNIGANVTRYHVTNSGDDALDPKPGTLRYGATMIKGKVWITFRKDMNIKLEKPLLVSSFTAIDGRGANVHISQGACIALYEVSNIIIHGLQIHHCKASKNPGQVVGPDGEMQVLRYEDGDAITVMSSKKVWIDHNTLYECDDGLIDVTLGSTDVTVTNNRFRNHDMVMLLGHDDAYSQDKNMRVTVAFNYFGPDLDQRMPRVRYGFAHVVNNLYEGWGLYAIGGSMNPSVKSEANLFIARDATNTKEVTKKMYGEGLHNSWNFKSVNDVFENGASFKQAGDVGRHPRYTPQQDFEVLNGKFVRALTRWSGALKCQKESAC